MLKIRRPLGRLIFNMGIAIPGKTVFPIETAPKTHVYEAYIMLVISSVIENVAEAKLVANYSLSHLLHVTVIVPYGAFNDQFSETEMVPFSGNLSHWLHWNFSVQQSPVQPVTTFSLKLQHFYFILYMYFIQYRDVFISVLAVYWVVNEK